MRARLPLLSLAALALIVVAAACSSTKNGPQPGPTIHSGAWTFTADTVVSDTCWQNTNVFPPTGIPLGYTMTTTSTSDDASLSFVPAPNVAPFLPEMTGQRLFDAITTTGANTVIVGTGCTLALGVHGVGTVTGTDTIEIELDATISADTVASNGQPSSCAAFQTTSYQMIPFPTLVPATNGSCGFGLAGPITRN